MRPIFTEKSGYFACLIDLIEIVLYSASLSKTWLVGQMTLQDLNQLPPCGEGKHAHRLKITTVDMVRGTAAKVSPKFSGPVLVLI